METVVDVAEVDFGRKGEIGKIGRAEVRIWCDRGLNGLYEMVVEAAAGKVINIESSRSDTSSDSGSFCGRRVGRDMEVIKGANEVVGVVVMGVRVDGTDPSSVVRDSQMASGVPSWWVPSMEEAAVRRVAE